MAQFTLGHMTEKSMPLLAAAKALPKARGLPVVKIPNKPAVFLRNSAPLAGAFVLAPFTRARHHQYP